MSFASKANRDDVDLNFAIRDKLHRNTIKNLKEDLARKEKFNSYTQRLVGELMELLLKKKILTSSECYMATTRAKAAIFTQQELIELQKIADKQMRESQQ